MSEELRRKYLDRLPLLDQLRSNLERETKEALSSMSHIDRVCFRVKGVNSFVEKAEDQRNNPPYENPLVEIEDQVAGRVIVFFLSDVEAVHKCLESTYSTVERSKRQPDRDAEFGYESDHLICIIPPHFKPQGWGVRDDVPPTFELQIRTIFMHAYAEPQHDIGYKTGHELPREIRRELAWIAASGWGADQAYERVNTWRQREQSKVSNE